MRSLRLALVLCTTLLGSEYASAAAFQFYELGTPIVGTADVGQAAVANDASTSYFNPAGMTLLNSSAFMLGSQMMLPYTNFTPSTANTIGGDNGGNAGSLVPVLGGFFVYDFSPKLKFGVSLTAPYGGSLNYTDAWVGRFNVQQMLFYTLNLNPSAAYKINDWAAVGAGVSIEYANLSQTLALPNPFTPLIDGQLNLKADNTAAGFNLGVMLTPGNMTKIGVAYRSQIVHHLHGNLSFLRLPFTPSASTKMVMPSNVIGSIAQDVNCQFTLLGELGWANWSSMRNNIIFVDGFSAVTPQNWHDTYRVGLGGQYKVNPLLMLQAGASYDSSPTSRTKRLPDLPMDRQIRAGTGLVYAIANAVNLGVSYEYINLGKANIYNASSNGVLAGHYSRNFANVLQASLNVNI